jgi:CID domain
VSLGVADYICFFRHDARKLAEHVATHFTSEPAERKLTYFYLVHETIFRSKDQGIEFVAAFGDLLMPWVQSFTQ